MQLLHVYGYTCVLIIIMTRLIAIILVIITITIIINYNSHIYIYIYISVYISVYIYIYVYSIRLFLGVYLANFRDLGSGWKSVLKLSLTVAQVRGRFGLKAVCRNPQPT